MCCSKFCLDIAVEGLKWLGNFVEKGCLNSGRGRITLKNPEGSQRRSQLSHGTDQTGDEVQYNIIINPEFSDGTKGWFGEGCSLSVGVVDVEGTTFYGIAHGRSGNCHGLAQEIGKRLDANVAYRFEAWVGIRGGDPSVKEAVVHASVKVAKASGGGEERILLSSVTVKKGQWCLLTGTLEGSHQPRDATVYIDGPDGSIDIVVSSVAVVPRKIVNLEGQVLDCSELSSEAGGSRRLKDDYFEVNIVKNSGFEDGLDNWYPMGDCTLTVEELGGPTQVGAAVKNSFVHTPAPLLTGKYIVCSNRTETYMGPCQDITDDIHLYQAYQVFAWVRTTLPFGSTTVDVALDVDGEWMQGGEEQVGLDWIQIQGSFRLESQPTMVQVYLQGPIAGVDIMVAGLQIFAVDRLARTPQLQKRAEAIRRREVIMKLRDSQGNPLPAGTKVGIEQVTNSFPMGTCINHDSLGDDYYTSYFLKHFNFAVFENELKWEETDPEEGDDRYKEADDMVNFCDSNNVPMRGHCLVWDVDNQVPDWVQALDGIALLAAVEHRVAEVMTKYKGQFLHYDVNNEMLQGDFFEEKLGADFLPYLFKVCRGLDPKPLLFVNEYNVENNYDSSTSPARYFELIKFLLKNGAPVGGIGIQGHLTVPIGSIIGDCLDTLGGLQLPIWFTEIDVSSKSVECRAADLEVILREAFSHPAVDGCLLWGFMEGAMARENACLVDSDHTINEAGQRVIDLRKEWTTNFECVLDSNGEIVFSGYHGNYNFTCERVGGVQALGSFSVDQGDGVLELQIILA